jgi:hypothetical protein
VAATNNDDIENLRIQHGGMGAWAADCGSALGAAGKE